MTGYDAVLSFKAELHPAATRGTILGGKQSCSIGTERNSICLWPNCVGQDITAAGLRFLVSGFSISCQGYNILVMIVGPGRVVTGYDTLSSAIADLKQQQQGLIVERC